MPQTSANAWASFSGTSLPCATLFFRSDLFPTKMRGVAVGTCFSTLASYSSTSSYDSLFVISYTQMTPCAYLKSTEFFFYSSLSPLISHKCRQIHLSKRMKLLRQCGELIPTPVNRWIRAVLPTSLSPTTTTLNLQLSVASIISSQPCYMSEN